MLGAPGTGKGTQGKLIGVHFKIPNISTGEILRTAIKNRTQLGNEAKAFMDRGELVPDDVMIGLIKERVKEEDCKNGFILDGFPRTVRQAEELLAFFDKIGLKLDQVIVFELAQNKIIKRLTSRRVCINCGKDYNIITNPPSADNKCEVCGGEIIQRPDDTEKTVTNRLKVYAEKTKPLIEYFQKNEKLKTFNADKSVQEINTKIINFLSENINDNN
jgi:adenylate kinase